MGFLFVFVFVLFLFFCFFVVHCWSFPHVSFSHCMVCPSLIYNVWLNAPLVSSNFLLCLIIVIMNGRCLIRIWNCLYYTSQAAVFIQVIWWCRCYSSFNFLFCVCFPPCVLCTSLTVSLEFLLLNSTSNLSIVYLTLMHYHIISTNIYLDAYNILQ